jgi:hypothetical protein
MDTQGRTMLLRGVNLAGSSKLPLSPDGATWKRDGFYDHRQVSFVGRPFPLDEADEHFSRLRRWGLTFLRFLITWEAIEHSGPGQYDEAYLDYLYAVIKKAGEYDFCLFVDPHQDVWSRFSGGCGAPGWTFERVGMDVTRFHVTGAALTHQEHGDPLPPMSWPTNHSKFAGATMYTLFFGGDDFAPHTKVDGLPVQDYLQQHYFNAVKQVAERLKSFPHVIGYETLNEPSLGYIGAPDVGGWSEKAFRRGVSPRIIESMLLAAGYPQDVEVWDIFRKSGMRRLNEEGVSLWLDGYSPVWRQNQVWDVDRAGNPVILRPEHFGMVNDRPVDFDSNYFRPFVERFIREIRAVDPAATIFVDPVPLELKGGVMRYGLPEAENIVHAPHWYDGLTLNLQRYLPEIGYGSNGRQFWPVLGRSQVRRSFANQVARLVDYSETGFGGVPTLIGETGIPFNINNKEAFGSGDFSAQVQALDDTLQAMEANLVSYTLWNYTPDNSNERGDLWNDEDLSIFSVDQQCGTADPDDGGRALPAVVRPYPIRLPGVPVHLFFNLKTRVFTCEFQLAPELELPAEFYVPALHYPKGVVVDITRGWAEFQPAAQRLRYFPNPAHTLHRVTLKPRLETA